MSTDTTPTEQTVMSEDQVLTSGTILMERYRLDRCLASGGYGDVWQGVDMEVSDRDVAVKILRTDAGNNDPDAVARMRQEAGILEAIQHPNIVSVYGFGSSPYGEFVVMEYLDGLAIDQLLQSEGPAESDRVIPVVRQLLGALQLAHSREILHRDIKPENIILSGERDSEVGEVAKLVDFGIAKVQRMLSDSDSGVTLVQTRSGGFIGTPRYTAPEQAVGDPMGPGVDLFSLGLVIAEWLTGRQRIDAERHAEVMSQLLSPEPLDVSDCPYRWQKWLSMMLCKNPRERLQDAPQALMAFEEMVVEGHEPSEFLEVDPFASTRALEFNPDADGDRGFSDHDGPLELDFDRVEQLEHQRRQQRGGATSPPNRPPESGPGEPDSPPKDTQEHIATRVRERPRVATSTPSPRKSLPEEPPKAGSTLVAIGWMIAVFILTVTLVLVLMFLISG